jgi:serine phosphatase RsbU (regulator of sigma subunit)
LSYSLISAVSLLYFFYTKQYKFFCRSQLTLILVLPFLLQWSLGGLTASGAVVLWSILSPIGALMFAGTTRSIPWFIAYVLLMVISGFQTGGSGWQQGTLPNTFVVLSFVMNIGGVSAIVFVLLRYFVRAREQAMAALDEEHQRVRQSLSLAMEVQQNLLPKANPQIDGLDIAGNSVYCDETGGDYYDFLEVGTPGEGKIGVVVGDVSGHGVSSALLMATARALIMLRASMPGEAAGIISDVNRHLSLDTAKTGNFMTFFYAELTELGTEIRWVRAGHDPALVYDPSMDAFDELKGQGVPLGFDESIEYDSFQRPIEAGQVIVIGTDGIWETHNRTDEMFGKEALMEIIRNNHTASARQIVDTVTEALEQFRGDEAPEDDITLVVIKVDR